MCVCIFSFILYVVLWQAGHSYRYLRQWHVTVSKENTLGRDHNLFQDQHHGDDDDDDASSLSTS